VAVAVPGQQQVIQPVPLDGEQGGIVGRRSAGGAECPGRSAIELRSQAAHEGLDDVPVGGGRVGGEHETLELE
jgi:hypothetical protein